MQFSEFCRAHGLLVQHIEPGRWVRVPTDDHPRTRNGAYKYLGSHGFVQNHATMQEVAMWQPEAHDEPKQIDHQALRQAEQRERQRIADGRLRAAARAKDILAAARYATHPYLASKGWPEMQGLVHDDKLVVPMRVEQRVVGCQLIDADGTKRFLPGQLCRAAVFVIGQGLPVWCEGYATALSLHQALQAARIKRSVVATFSAHNLQQLATSGFVVADNDESGTGERAAQAAGQPFWMPDRVGEDFNDYMARVGLFRASQAIKAALMRPG